MAWLPDHIWRAQQAQKAKVFVKSKGTGKGKGKGWLPDHIWLAQKMQRMRSAGKGGRVVSKFATKPQFSKFKPQLSKFAKKPQLSKFAKKLQTKQPKAGKRVKTEAEIKLLEKLKETDSSLKVWVGGLTPGFDWKKLQQHFQKVGRPKLVHVYDKGTAVVTFDSADKVRKAIATMNRSKLNGLKLEVDVWGRPDKADGASKPKKTLKPQPKMATSKFAKKKGLKQQNVKSVAKAAAKPKVDEKLMEKLKEVDSSLKVWVGGLAKSTTWKTLRAHFMQASAKPKLVHINEKSRNGVVTFAEESDVQEAIGVLNGSELDGKSIELDVWARPEKK